MLFDGGRIAAWLGLLGPDDKSPSHSGLRLTAYCRKRRPTPTAFKRAALCQCCRCYTSRICSLADPSGCCGAKCTRTGRPECFITSNITSEMRVLPSAWVSLVILKPLEPACANSQNKISSCGREAVARARPRSALPASATANRTSVVVDRGRGRQRERWKQQEQQ
jgi:hypothetical protein